MRRLFSAIFLFVIGMLAIAGTARADGMIVPINFRPDTLLGDLYSVKYHRVHVDIQDQLATTTIEQAFVNETRGTIEVEYIFPIPVNAQINKFSLFVGEQEMQGKILTKEEARKVYEDIVRRQRDPALLEYIGQDMVRTSVFPLPPGAERKIKIVYTELLKKDGNRVEYRYPLNTEKFSKKMLEDVGVDFKLNSGTPLKTVYSPTHDAPLTWEGNTRVTGRWRDKNVRPDGDFRLFWTLSSDDVGATLFTYRPNGNEDGFFLFLASPKTDVGNQKAIAKNIIVVLDISGSMEGEKIDQARGAARFIAEHLNPQDRFNIIFYNDTISPLWPGLRDYTSENRREAIAAIDRTSADSNTNIHKALTTALGQMKDRSRPNFILFLTDGLPTAGITDTAQITSAVTQANTNNSRLFVFGVGYDVDSVFLDRLGVQNHGFAEFVRPAESIEGAVSAFFSKIQNPALTDLSLDFGAIITRDMYPRAMPDIFRGGQLVVVGRYKGAGPSTITLTGNVGEKKQTFTYKVNFANRTDREEFPFVARLWAQKKIGWLIEQIRLKGENKEYVDEIVALSTRFGIITEYTSFLAREDVNLADTTANTAEARKNIAARTKVVTGAGGINQSIQSGTMQKAAQAPNKAAYLNEAGEEIQVTNVKIIGSKTFYLKSGVWTDSEYKPSMKIVELKTFDAPYFELANREPTQAQYMSFAPKQPIIVVIDGVAYKIMTPK